MAEKCCLVMGTCKGCPRHPVDFHKHAYGGGHQMTHFLKAVIVMVLGLIMPSDIDRAVFVGSFQV